MHSELVIPFEKGKTLSCVLTTPAAKASPVGIVLAHGAGGDLHSGNLARFAESFAGAGFLCLRFTCKPTQLPYRVKACQAGAKEISPSLVDSPGCLLNLSTVVPACIAYKDVCSCACFHRPSSMEL